MKYTGERVIPKLMKPKNGLLIEHIRRYEFSRNICKGRVLDLACGVGYGSEILLESPHKINELVGIDINKESIDYAKEHYSYFETSYFVDDALNNNLHEIYGTFDTIVSFETIEHFKGDFQFIKNLYNLLRHDGTLIISTPLGIGKNKPCSCPFHVYQYREEEFLQILSPFKSVTMYHQAGSIIEIPKINIKYYLMIAVCKKH